MTLTSVSSASSCLDELARNAEEWNRMQLPCGACCMSPLHLSAAVIAQTFSITCHVQAQDADTAGRPALTDQPKWGWCP